MEWVNSDRYGPEKAILDKSWRLPDIENDDLTASDDPTRKMMRQIAGAFAEYEKARLVSKLRHARERVRQEKGKCEGRKPHGELRPDAVALAKRLHRASPKTGKRMSLRKIAAALAEAGHLNERGQPFNQSQYQLGRVLIDRRTCGQPAKAVR